MKNEEVKMGSSLPNEDEAIDFLTPKLSTFLVSHALQRR